MITVHAIYGKQYKTIVSHIVILNCEMKIQITFADFADLAIKSLSYSKLSTSLTCTSIGRPVNSMQWLKDDKIIYRNSSMYSQGQELSDGGSAIYQHILSSDAESNFQGRFTCVVEDIYGNSDRKTTMINSKADARF